VWRPRSLAGAVVAGVVCFAAASSNALAALYLPLVAARVIALPRVREQAATIGLIVGGALQLPAVLTLSRHTQSTRLRAERNPALRTAGRRDRAGQVTRGGSGIRAVSDTALSPW
jgi:hypothetical protein